MLHATQVRQECLKVTKMSLFNTNHNKSSRLEEFEQGQMQAIDQVGNYLKVSRSTQGTDAAYH